MFNDPSRPDFGCQDEPTSLKRLICPQTLGEDELPTFTSRGFTDYFGSYTCTAQILYWNLNSRYLGTQNKHGVAIHTGEHCYIEV